MAREHAYARGRLERLGALSDFKVSADSPDVRGWPVESIEGARIGEVSDMLVDIDAKRATYLLVRPDGEAAAARREVAIPTARAEVNRPSHTVKARIHASQVATLPPFTGTIAGDYLAGFGEEPTRPAGDRDADEARVTRSAEELSVGKRTVPAGEVKVSKHVETEHVEQPVTRYREEPDIRRERVTGREESEPLREDEVRIPLSREEIVVEKRPVVKEEIVVGKKVVEERDRVEADLQRERIDVEPPRDRRD